MTCDGMDPDCRPPGCRPYGKCIFQKGCVNGDHKKLAFAYYEGYEAWINKAWAGYQ